ncbi:patatin-like phospholipase family protein, partial [Legionella sp.]|uniref:patatin-like phospholipase family protein n=1 Tax=Legionella sp. TaxID=459 RepID=UPI00321FD06A
MGAPQKICFLKYFIFQLLLVLLFLTGCTSLEFSRSPGKYHPKLPDLHDVKIAFVLGGGGAKGIAHVGVLEELSREGIHPDLIVGCSAGAIVGALYADNPDVHRLKKLLMEKKREHLLDISLRYLPYGISKGYALQQFLTDNLEAKTFEQLKIPFVSVATSLEFGDLVLFGTGPLEPAVRASAAFPGVFHPVRINGHYFVDGGVVNITPVEVAKRLGAEFVNAIELDNQLSDSPPNHLIGIIKRCLEISLSHQGRHATKEADFV